MIQIMPWLFVTFLSIFSGIYGIYFAYIAYCAKKPWNIKINKDFQPKISILIPLRNEENLIEKKLENVKNVSYPKELIEILVAADDSGEQTLQKVQNFVENNPELNIKIVRQSPRCGKSAVLNKALAISTHPIVVVSDVDTTWPPYVLRNTLPYLSNHKIGAVTCKGVNQNGDQNWVTKAEKSYLDFVSLVRLGESKIHSTIRFEGGFCAYKRSAFEKFDCETGADDSGTSLEVIQKNYRAIFVPEALFYTEFPTKLVDKLKIKARRANQLIGLWVKCLKLLFKNRLLLPKKIAVPEILLFIVNPLILFALIITTITNVAFFPFSLLSMSALLLILCLLLFARRMFFELLINNFILLYALISFMVGRRYVSWENACK